MTVSKLTTSLAIEPSQLYVGDIQKMSDFYTTHAGLSVLESSSQRALLGDDSIGIVELLAKPKLAHASPREAGLFHNAILFSSRGALSRTAGDILMNRPELFTGTGDHLVSEAFYFNDPEGNGVELYYDRPQTSWNWVDGMVQMDTLYIDPLDYIMKNASEKAGEDKKIGHVHLRIGDITQARIFYINLLGFDITASLPGALFVSIGGYHHHIGLNTWFSDGAGVRAPSLGLGQVTITLGSSEDVTQLAIRLEQAAYPFRHKGSAVYVDDPWGNTLVFLSR